MSKDIPQTLDNLVSEYINYTTEKNIIKECEVKFGTLEEVKDNIKNKIIRISKYDFENVILKLQNCGFSSSYVDNLMRISCDDCVDKKIENIRLELTGQHVINEYCKNENLLTLLGTHDKFTKIVKKYYPKKNGLKYKSYNNYDFGFKTSFQLEEELLNDDPIIKNNLLQNYNTLPKYYRYINRTEYINSNYPFKCHLSMVKQSKVTSQNIQKSGVLNNKITYEIEIELNNELITIESDPSVIISKLKTVIKYILCGLQDTKYPISYKEMDLVKKEYLKIFSIDTLLNDIKPKDFIGYSTKTLKLLNIQPNSLSNDINIRNNYTVTEKADGLRKLLYINNNGTIYMIDTQFKVQYTGMHTKIKDIFNTILDGEHIKYDKSKKYINMFAAFDIYMLNNIDKRIEPFIYVDEKDSKKKG